MKTNETIKEKLAGISMTVQEAIKIVSPGDRCLPNMIKALQLSPWQNTDEEWKRLKAAILITRNKKRIHYDGPKTGYYVK